MPLMACFSEETCVVDDVVSGSNIDDFVLLVSSREGEVTGFGELGDECFHGCWWAPWCLHAHLVRIDFRICDGAVTVPKVCEEVEACDSGESKGWVA